MRAVIVEYRDKNGALEWKRSYAGWEGKDIYFLNKACGYEKYRERAV